MKKQRRSPSNKTILTPRKERYANGWLSPIGTYWPCRPEGHMSLADRITKSKKYDGERQLEIKQWIKVSDNQWYMHGYFRLSQRQIDFVFDWCRLNGRVYPPAHIECLIEDMDNGLV